MNRFLYVLAFLCVILSLTACGPTKDKELPQVYTGYTAEYIYAQGHMQMMNNDYFDAIRSYKSLAAQFPFTPLAEKGMVDLVYVYYMNDDVTMSLALGEQFIKMYPYSKLKGYVYYMIGVVGFEDGRGLLQTYGPYNMDLHDPSGYADAYINLEKAIKLDPKGSFVRDAKRRMVYLNNSIAKYYLNIAHFYYKRGAFNAAINRAAEVIQKYPQSSSTENALVVTIQSYRKLGLTKQANDNMLVLKKNYPKNNYLRNIEEGTPKGWFSSFIDWL